MDCSSTLSKSKSSAASFLRVSMTKRVTSAPACSTTSRRVTKVPARLLILKGSPFFHSFTSWISLMSSGTAPPDSAATAAFIRFT